MPHQVLLAAALGAGAGAIGLSTVTILGSAIIGGAVVYGGLALAQYLVTPRPSLAGQSISQGQADTRKTIVSAIEPARWILGRARTGGVLVYLYSPDEDDKILHMMLVLCEGPIEGIEKIWINGEELPWQDSTGEASITTSGEAVEPLAESNYAEHLQFRFFHNGAEAAKELQEAGGQWSEEHQLTGKACVHIKLTQTDYGSDRDARLYSNLPRFEFLVKGLKFAHPESRGREVWTDNSAAIRYWWLTQRRQIPTTAISSSSFRQAFNICETLVDNQLTQELEDEGFEASSKRYTINGIITSTDNHDQVEKEMDFTWAGYVVEEGGFHYFRPGTTRPIRASIEPSDIITRLGIQPAPAMSDRINSATMRISQSAHHEWLEYGLDDLQDQDAINRDGRLLQRDFGSRAFVSTAPAAGRLLAIMLRRARANKIYSVRLSPGSELKYFNLLPTDRVRLNDPELGIENESLAITAKTINSDFSIDLTLESEPDGIYADTAINPSGRGIAYRRSGGLPPSPSNVQATASVFRTDDNTIHSIIEVSWAPTSHRTRVRVEGPFDDTAETSNSSIKIFVPYQGTYTLKIQHINRFFVSSNVVSKFVVIDWEGVIVNTASVGVESIFALVADTDIEEDGSIDLEDNQLPSNSWGFRRGGIAGGLRWHNSPQSLTPSKNVQITSIRFIEGTPAVGAAVKDEWQEPVVYGRSGGRGQDGTDGLGIEDIFARSTADNSRPSNPLNSWGFDEPEAPWSDAAPPLSITNKVLWRSSRRLVGSPDRGDPVSALWSSPSIVGRYGDRGARGAKGDPGEPAPRLWTRIFNSNSGLPISPGEVVSTGIGAETTVNVAVAITEYDLIHCVATIGGGAAGVVWVSDNLPSRKITSTYQRIGEISTQVLTAYFDVRRGGNTKQLVFRISFEDTRGGFNWESRLYSIWGISHTS